MSTVRDHRGVPCLSCHHACWNPSGASSLPCNVVENGQYFTYTLPAKAVATFTWPA
ncbi:MAG TPA: hypothetical protein VGS19_13690 [Streptosporangiaceae bacterium]|nr:hypothetical protein [Streptosporangiaceae bacterium]